MGSELGLTPESSHAARLDGLAIFYIVLTVTWTFLLLSGVAYLTVRRDSPVVRVRGLVLSLGAVLFLHLYWISVQLGYVLGPLYPGDCEYWIMGTYFPFGIALFHAGNSRFLYVADGQRKFVEGRVDEKDAAEKKGWAAKFKKLDHTKKVFVLVGTGMVFQIVVTILMYLLSRKWHSAWGIPGTEANGDSEMERKVNMGRGWEWWHTVFWQFFWAWIVAPIVLWKSRNIRDTQGWRLQTVGCCIASLHATPMWLIALYVPGMEKVNKYFIPPQWIALSIMVLEIFAVFVPVYEAHRCVTLKKETLDCIAQWESRNQALARSAVKSIASVGTSGDGGSPTRVSFHSHSHESILTLGALEHVLERNPGPLLEFSALRDFSGENIAFLTSVANWKASFPSIMTEDVVRSRYNQALRIYAAYVGIHDAEFQINLPSQILRKLEAAFEGPARAVYGVKKTDPATPFAALERSKSAESGSDDGSEKTIVAEEGSTEDVILGEKVQFWGEMPDEFNVKVFDEAEANIKYLVLTNTWPKFVKERRSSMDSIETA